MEEYTGLERVVAVAQVAELLKICRRREAVVDRNGSLDRGLDTQSRVRARYLSADEC
jgi:hypothetical protein